MRIYPRLATAIWACLYMMQLYPSPELPHKEVDARKPEGSAIYGHIHRQGSCRTLRRIAYCGSMLTVTCWCMVRKLCHTVLCMWETRRIAKCRRQGNKKKKVQSTRRRKGSLDCSRDEGTQRLEKGWRPHEHVEDCDSSKERMKYYKEGETGGRT